MCGLGTAVIMMLALLECLRPCRVLLTAVASSSRSSGRLLPTESWARPGGLYACAHPSSLWSSPALCGERPTLPLKATYGAPEPTHGSPAIMVRMSVRHCVEISSRGDGVAVLAWCSLLLQNRGKRRPRRTQPSAIRRRRTTRARLTGEPSTARWRDLQRHWAAAAA